jgi:hypothetical protein
MALAELSCGCGWTAFSCHPPFSRCLTAPTPAPCRNADARSWFGGARADALAVAFGQPWYWIGGDGRAYATSNVSPPPPSLQGRCAMLGPQYLCQREGPYAAKCLADVVQAPTLYRYFTR